MSTKKTTLYDTKFTPVITETPDSVSIGDNVSEPSMSSSDSGFDLKEKLTNLFSSSYTIYILILSLIHI